jgi:hypothetical protein
MTRYSNQLPHTQVPNTQGRPAGQPAQAPQYEQPVWPQQSNVPRTAGRPAAPGYADPAGYADPQSGAHQQAAHHDPYAALRPDGYGYGQPPQQPAPDPYGLAGYTAPQPQQTYANRAPQQAPQQPAAYGAADPYGAGGGYGGAPQQAPASPYATPAQPAHGYGSSGPAFAARPTVGAAPQPQGGYGSSAYGQAQPASAYNQVPDQWGQQSLSVDARDYGHAYANPPDGQWGTDHYGDQLDPALGGGGYPNVAQQTGSFDQSYAEDEAQYEDEPRRSGWKKVVGLVACTVLVGGALTIGYTSIMGPSDSRSTPVIKGAEGPSKVKPSDPGGKTFAHADNKIMGRLGEGGDEEGSDPAGVRRVPVVNVGRDGSIQPPAATEPQEEGTRAVVAVPGLTVIDGLGGGPSPNRLPGQSAPVQMVASADPNPPAAPPPKKKVIVADADEPSVVQTKATVKADPPPAPPKKEKVAALAPADAPAGPQPTGAGYVAVLASVPASGSSRIDALKQFADMQQKYGVILQNKTPDIQEANLGEKGTYHRLLVGPPGSRDSASSVCTQLKAQGYSGCWVTAY